MINSDVVFSAYLFLILGIVFFSLTAFLLFFLPKNPSRTNPQSKEQLQENSHTNNNNLFLLIQPGGKIADLSPGALKLFNKPGRKPNLENLIRATKPANLFLNLCTREGQATFSLNGKLIEGISRIIPKYQTKNQGVEFLISLQQPSLINTQAVTLDPSSYPEERIHNNLDRKPSIYTLSTLARINQEITLNLDLDHTIRKILDNCKDLLPADFLELTLWEDCEKQPYIYRLPSKNEHVNLVERSNFDLSIHQGYASQLITNQEALIVQCLRDPTQIRSNMEPIRYPFQSYLGYPILDKERVIALIEFASLEKQTYHPEDIHTLHYFSGQIAITLNNALQFRSEHRKAVELSGLADLTQAMNAIHEPQNLFQHLVDSISPLFKVKMLGFVVYNESRRELMTQIPFQGIDSPSVLSWYQFYIEPQSPAEEIWLSKKTIITEDAAEDNRLKAFSLDDFARVAGIHNSIMVPLSASGQIIGYLWLGNKLDGKSFDQEDERFLKIIAGKVAPIIQNANLITLSRQRAHRAETLHRISTLARSNASLDEKLKFSVLDLARLLNADHAAVYLIDSSTEHLKLHNESIFGIQINAIGKFKEISLHEKSFQETACFSQKLIISECAEKLFSLPDLYQILGQELQDLSIAAIPLIINQQGVGELILGGRQNKHFSSQDINTAITACELMVSGIEPSIPPQEQYQYNFIEPPHKLAGSATPQTSPGSNNTNSHEYKSERIDVPSLLKIFSECSNTTDLNHALKTTLKTLKEFTGSQIVCIWSNQSNDNTPHILAYLSDSEPIQDKKNPEKESWLREIITEVLEKGEPILIQDLLKEESQSKQLSTFQPELIYRSALATPLKNGVEIIGCLLMLHSEKSFFSSDLTDLTQTIANQISIAINHSRLYELIHDQSEDFGGLLRSQQVETSKTKAILEAVGDGVLVIDSNLKITLFNPSAEKILNLQSKEILGNSFELLSRLLGEAAQQWAQTIFQWTKQPSSCLSSGQFVLQIDLLPHKIISLNLAPVFLNNEFIGTVSVFRDITHQVEVDRLKSEFITTVSHELQTPMTSIKGYIDLLMMSAASTLSEQQGNFLQIIKSNTERLSFLVNDLLDISKFEIRPNGLILQSINLEEIVDQTFEQYQQLAQKEQKSIQFIKNLVPDLPRIYGDHQSIQQILNNVVDNAYQYNINNGNITILATCEAGKIEITVQDTGVGIPHHELPRIFERFYRGEASLDLGVSGSGLGLSIAKNLVEMHQGQIWIESQGISGDGTKVVIELPIDEAIDF